MSAATAVRLDLLPADHALVLHPVGRRGLATVAQRGLEWREVPVPLRDLPTYCAAMRGATDVFVSQQSFFGWRRIAQLAQLGAAYVDLDYYRTGWAGELPERVADAVLRALDDARRPAPSYILSSGRGLLVVWLHDLVPRGALPRWMAAQRHLAGALRSFGADPRAVDAARVFRLAGTRHSGADADVRPVWMAGPAASLGRWDFDDFCHEVLPVERAELVVLRARRAERAAAGTGVAPARKLDAASYWETVLADLQRLRTERWFGPLPPGHRDTWLFLACNAMTYLAPATVLQREFHALAAEAGGWDTRECDNRMSSVLRRAERNARGERVEWDGRLVDARYRFKAETIIEWLAVTPAEMRSANLRVLIDRDVAREHAAERKRASRSAAGVQSRAEWTVEHRIEHDRPWEAEGIGRATWYRRRAAQRLK